MEWSLLKENNRDSNISKVLIYQSMNKLKYEMKKRDLLDNKQYIFSSIPSKDSIFGELLTIDANTGNFIF